MKTVRNLAIITAVVGAAWYIWYQVQLSFKLGYSYKNVKIREINKERIVIAMDFVIKNDTPLNVTIRVVDLDVYANDKFVTTIYSDVRRELLPNSTIDLPVVIAINPKDIFRNLNQILFGAGIVQDMKLTMKGKLKVSKSGIPLIIPYKYTSLLKEWM